MTLSAGFFDSVNGDRVYSAEDFSLYLEGLVTNGCLPNDTGLLATANPAAIDNDPPSVILKAGKAYLDGLWFYNSVDFIYEMGTGQILDNDFYHLIYLCFDTTEAVRTVSIEHIASTDPEIPADSAGKYYMPIAKVKDYNGIQNPETADIEDLRWYAGISGTGITTASLVDGSVTEPKLATNSVSNRTIIDLAVTEGKLGNSAVTGGKIANGAVTEGKLGTGAVTEAKIGGGAVTESKLGTAAVTEAKIGALAISGSKIQNDAIIFRHLTAGLYVPFASDSGLSCTVDSWFAGAEIATAVGAGENGVVMMTAGAFNGTSQSPGRFELSMQYSINYDTWAYIDASTIGDVSSTAGMACQFSYAFLITSVQNIRFRVICKAKSVPQYAVTTYLYGFMLPR